MQPEPDPLFDAFFQSKDWFAQAGAGEAWAKAARAFEAVDPAAARIAWDFAARAYGFYVAEYDAHLPASRWDYDYQRELAEAEERARTLPAGAPSERLPEWVRLALDRRFTAAIELVKGPPSAPEERALLAVLAHACWGVQRKEDWERLASWSKDPAS